MWRSETSRTSPRIADLAESGGEIRRSSFALSSRKDTKDGHDKGRGVKTKAWATCPDPIPRRDQL